MDQQEKTDYTRFVKPAEMEVKPYEFDIDDRNIESQELQTQTVITKWKTKRTSLKALFWTFFIGSLFGLVQLFICLFSKNITVIYYAFVVTLIVSLTTFLISTMIYYVSGLIIFRKRLKYKMIYKYSKARLAFWPFYSWKSLCKIQRKNENNNE
ncbi:hypothetical protein [Mycoplasmopsis primatum]|uniref:hypothetical protein n=1 Tax=Mycoplasmopsis primatum TaxID=55604 RepID=UPI00049543BE|nr:hypothetical protein [Mycoplasmopsis primatum]